MNRPFDRETENELLRAAEENPGSALRLDAKGHAQPVRIKAAFSLVYHSEQRAHDVPRARVAYLLRAARSRGLAHRPRLQPSGDYLLPDLATIFRRQSAAPVRPARNLSCCCCGQRTTGRQWWNRDTGYGVCTPCGNATASKEGEAAAASYYGTRGIHWDL
jgi:hypothetical protein